MLILTNPLKSRPTRRLHTAGNTKRRIVPNRQHLHSKLTLIFTIRVYKPSINNNHIRRSTNTVLGFTCFCSLLSWWLWFCCCSCSCCCCCSKYDDGDECGQVHHDICTYECVNVCVYQKRKKNKEGEGVGENSKKKKVGGVDKVNYFRWVSPLPVRYQGLNRG